MHYLQFFLLKKYQRSMIEEEEKRINMINKLKKFAKIVKKSQAKPEPNVIQEKVASENSQPVSKEGSNVINESLSSYNSKQQRISQGQISSKQEIPYKKEITQKKEISSKKQIDEGRVVSLIIPDDNKLKEKFIDCLMALQITVKLKTREMVEQQMERMKLRQYKRKSKTSKDFQEKENNQQKEEIPIREKRKKKSIPLYNDQEKDNLEQNSVYSEEEYQSYHRRQFFYHYSRFYSEEQSTEAPKSSNQSRDKQSSGENVSPPVLVQSRHEQIKPQNDLQHEQSSNNSPINQ